MDNLKTYIEIGLDVDDLAIVLAAFGAYCDKMDEYIKIPGTLNRTRRHMAT